MDRLVVVHGLVVAFLVARASCRQVALPTQPPFDYHQAGVDWGGNCQVNLVQQSPVDLPLEAPTAPDVRVMFDYRPWKTIVVRRTTTGLVVDFKQPFNVYNVPAGAGSEEAAGYVDVDGSRFPLRRLELHSPSEHKLGGSEFALEVQLWHDAAPEAHGSLAVALLISEQPGGESPLLAALAKALPLTNGTARFINGPSRDSGPPIPDGAKFLHYQGSQTAPPCDGHVQWLVGRQPVPVDGALIEWLVRPLRALDGGNARAVQPLGPRHVRPAAVRIAPGWPTSSACAGQINLLVPLVIMMLQYFGAIRQCLDRSPTEKILVR